MSRVLGSARHSLVPLLPFQVRLQVEIPSTVFAADRKQL